MPKMSSTQFNRDLRALLEKIKTTAVPLPEDGRAERMSRAREDFFFFAQTYLPHYFECEPADFHREMIRLFLEPREVARPIVIAAPRGFAKSTVASFAFPLWLAVTERARFIVIVSANDDLSESLTSDIRTDLQNNDRIIADYGELYRDGEKGDFSVGQTRILSRTWRKGARGFRKNSARPDVIILDDLEKDEEAKNPQTVGKILDAITKNFYPALKAKNGKLIYVGTVLRKNSVVGKILAQDEEPYSNWSVRHYRAIETNDSGVEVSLWPAAWPLSNLHELRRQIGTRAFMAEFQNSPVDDGDSVFRESYFRFVNLADIPLSNCTGAIFVDPAAGEQSHNDYKAITAVALDREKMNYYVLYAWLRRASISDMLHATFRIYRMFPGLFKTVGVESNGFQMLLRERYEELAHEYGFYLPIEMVNHSTNKLNRIERRSVLFENGHVIFPLADGGDVKLLIEQFIEFPRGRHDDGPDSFDSAVTLLEKAAMGSIGGIYAGVARSAKRLFRGWRD